MIVVGVTGERGKVFHRNWKKQSDERTKDRGTLLFVRKERRKKYVFSRYDDDDDFWVFYLHCLFMIGPDQRNSANIIFCSWMAIGNILGFLSGSSGNWHTYIIYWKSSYYIIWFYLTFFFFIFFLINLIILHGRWFLFLKSIAWCEACGNLKASFLVAVVSF